MKDNVLVAEYLYSASGDRIAAPGITTAPVVDDQDRLLSYGSNVYTYTANGELRTKTDTTTNQTTSYFYDGIGALRRVDLPDGRVIEYVIDPAGRRIGKKINGTLVKGWLYSGALTPVAELDGSGAVVSRFVGGGYFTKGGSTYRIVRDHLGSPRLVVDASTGAVAQRLDVDEYGRVTTDTNPGFQPFGFAGGIYDPDLGGLVRFGARDYDPETGRWTSKEPLGFAGSFNFYAYAGGDPVNRVDLTGLRFGQIAPGAMPAFTRLASNPVLGPLLEQLERSKKLIDILTVAANAETAAFGGSVTRSNRKRTRFQVDLDAPFSSSAAEQCGFSSPANMDELLAHELGHVYSEVFLKGKWSSEMSLEFENALHPELPRTEHDCALPICFGTP